MSTTISKLNFDVNVNESLPEYIREDIELNNHNAFKILSDTVKLESVNTIDSNTNLANDDSTEVPEFLQSDKLKELSDLWPGVHQDIQQFNKNTPSFYLTIGFMAGAFMSIIAVWIYSMVNPMTKANSINKVVLSSPLVGNTTTSLNNSDVISPITPIYEVQSGDTLASIALKNYKRISPRLLDEICKKNNLSNANKLSLGQKLSLPKYNMQSGKVVN